MERVNRKSICIVTPGYISSTPRVVKEADALWQAGYDVRVVFTQGNLERVRAFDRSLLADKHWRWETVEWSPHRSRGRWLYHYSKVRYHLGRRVPHSLVQLYPLAELGEGRVYPELARLAAAERADLYIGHYPTGLAAAAYAAQRWGTLLGYDAEDLHTADEVETPASTLRRERIRTIESRYLPRCSHVTAVSELVAAELANRYRIPKPLAIHNVFPWRERARIDGKICDRQGEALSLYWYSQVIGEGRGIEDAIRAVGLMGTPIQIHLRGSLSETVRSKFEALARETGIGSSLFFHAPVAPQELLSRAVEHDVGLALEHPNTLNHALTASNKLFMYLLAGLAIAATDVPGQRGVMQSCPDTGFTYCPGDYQALAFHLKQLATNPARLQTHKRAALQAAERQWNWEIESLKLVATIAHCLSLT